MLKDDARIWWGVVAQLRNVHTMSWTEFQKAFGERYFSDAFKGSIPITAGSQWGRDLTGRRNGGSTHFARNVDVVI